jgi:hypothetical protein
MLFVHFILKFQKQCKEDCTGRFIYCEITFIRGVPIFVGRLIHEIKNPTNNDSWEAD